VGGSRATTGSIDSEDRERGICRHHDHPNGKRGARLRQRSRGRVRKPTAVLARPRL